MMFKKILNSSCPLISIVVVVFNMKREANRTLYSLSTKYQQGVNSSDYEVIVVENGSSEPLSTDFVASFGPNFKYYFLNTQSKSPAGAINFGVNKSKGEFVGLMIDGARILTSGVIKYALLAARLYPNPIIGTLAWHLGPDIQCRSVMKGYTKETEDKLLSSINWMKNGYKLFEVSSFAGSSKDGFFMPIAESNCFFMRRKTFHDLGGYDERFDMPGGGLVNLDIYKRACELPDSNLIIILGEGTFHQIHGGVSTSILGKRNLLWRDFEKQYIKIRKSKYFLPNKSPEYIGHVPPELFRFIHHSVQNAVKILYEKHKYFGYKVHNFLSKLKNVLIRFFYSLKSV